MEWYEWGLFCPMVVFGCPAYIVVRYGVPQIARRLHRLLVTTAAVALVVGYGVQGAAQAFGYPHLVPIAGALVVATILLFLLAFATGFRLPKSKGDEVGRSDQRDTSSPEG